MDITLIVLLGLVGSGLLFAFMLYVFMNPEKGVYVFFFLVIISSRYSEVTIDLPFAKIPLIEPFFFIMLFVFFVHRLTTRIKVSYEPYGKIWLFFLIIGFVSLAQGLFISHHEVSDALGRFRRFILYPTSFFIVLQFVGDDVQTITRRLLKTFVAGGAVIFLYSIVRLTFGFDVYPEDLYLMFTYHIDGWFLAFNLFFFVLYGTLQTRGAVTSISARIMAFLSLLLIIFTLRRGVWLAVAAGMFITYTLLDWRKAIRSMFKVAVVFSIVVVFIMIVLPILPITAKYDFVGNLTERVLQTSSEQFSTTEVGGSGSFLWRLYALAYGVEIFLSNPVFGQGMGVASTFAVPGIGKMAVADHTLHDAYLELLVNMGILGFIPFVMFHKNVIVNFLRSRKMFGNAETPVLCSVFVLYLTGMMWTAVDVFLSSNVNFIIFIYMLCGILAKASRSRLQTHPAGN